MSAKNPRGVNENQLGLSESRKFWRWREKQKALGPASPSSSFTSKRSSFYRASALNNAANTHASVRERKGEGRGFGVCA